MVCGRSRDQVADVVIEAHHLTFETLPGRTHGYSAPQRPHEDDIRGHEMHTVRSSQNCVITQASWLPDVSQWTNVWHSALDSIPHQPQEPLLTDCGLEGHL